MFSLYLGLFGLSCTSCTLPLITQLGAPPEPFPTLLQQHLPLGAPECWSLCAVLRNRPDGRRTGQRDLRRTSNLSVKGSPVVPFLPGLGPSVFRSLGLPKAAKGTDVQRCSLTQCTSEPRGGEDQSAASQGKSSPAGAELWVGRVARQGPKDQQEQSCAGSSVKPRMGLIPVQT